MRTFIANCSKLSYLRFAIRNKLVFYTMVHNDFSLTKKNLIQPIGKGQLYRKYITRGNGFIAVARAIFTHL